MHLSLTEVCIIRWSLILVSILSVSLLHYAVTSCPSYLAGKGEELWIQKIKTYTTVVLRIACSKLQKNAFNWLTCFCCFIGTNISCHFCSCLAVIFAAVIDVIFAAVSCHFCCCDWCQFGCYATITMLCSNVEYKHLTFMMYILTTVWALLTPKADRNTFLWVFRISVSVNSSCN